MSSSESAIQQVELDVEDSVSPAKSQPPEHGYRRALMLGGIGVAALLGGALWFFSDRYVSTEDAYVKTDKVTVSAQVSGLITQVEVRENQPVHRNDVLFRLDDRSYRIALAKADASLLTVKTELESLKASLQEKRSALALAVTRRDFALRTLRRRQQLFQRRLGSEVDTDEAQYQLDVAEEQIRLSQQAVAQLMARLDGNPNLPTKQYAPYQIAQAARDAVALDLQNTAIRAPFDGVASQVPKPGQFISAGSPAMSVIATKNAWVEANFMETDLANVRPGQPVRIEIDAYPGSRFDGRVESISHATGAEFSVLPPQNASGNWVKITQRIPLRVAIVSDSSDVARNAPVLRAGMTAEVRIDTRPANSKSRLP